MIYGRQFGKRLQMTKLKELKESYAAANQNLTNMKDRIDLIELLDARSLALRELTLHVNSLEELQENKDKT